MTPRILRHAALALVAAVLMVGVLAARALETGREEMAASDAAFDRGDVRTAVLHARRAATLYLPGAPHVAAAYDRLTAVAVGSEARGDAQGARAAWRAIRGAALETRHVWVPRSKDLARANANLARLSVLPETLGTDSGKRARAEARAQLEDDDAPLPVWVAVLASGFALIVVGGCAGVLRGLTPSGSVARGAARWVAAATALAGMLAWVLAAWKA